MKTRIAVILACFVIPLLLAAQNKPDPNTEEAAIKQAALDYAEGYYEGSGERMERAIHPLLCKRGLVTAGPQGEPFLIFMNSEMLIEAARSARGKLDADKRNISVTVLDFNEHTASAKVFTAQFNDFLHLAKVNGQWRIVNVLWCPPVAKTTLNPAQEREGISAMFREFRKAGDDKDAERAKRLLHPGFLKRTFGSPGPGAKWILQDGNGETMAQVVRMGRAVTPKDQAEPDVRVLDVYENMGTLKVSTPVFTEYQHVVRQNGQWLILNTLATRLVPLAGQLK